MRKFIFVQEYIYRIRITFSRRKEKSCFTDIAFAHDVHQESESSSSSKTKKAFKAIGPCIWWWCKGGPAHTGAAHTRRGPRHRGGQGTTQKFLESVYHRAQFRPRPSVRRSKTTENRFCAKSFRGRNYRAFAALPNMARRVGRVVQASSTSPRHSNSTDGTTDKSTFRTVVQPACETRCNRDGPPIPHRQNAHARPRASNSEAAKENDPARLFAHPVGDFGGLVGGRAA